jgi:hypothetical protein
MALTVYDNNVYDMREERDKHLIPESLFISALIDSGQYSPEMYKVLDHHIMSIRQIHNFCREHQARAGRAPDLGLVRRKYPAFAYMVNQDPHWAAANLIQAWNFRGTRKEVSDYLLDVGEPDANTYEAYQKLVQGLGRYAIGTHRSSSVTDYDLLDDDSSLSRVPVDLDGNGRLTRLTGGIAPGNLWYIAARLGVGKSWKLLTIAVAAAEAGWNVKFYSLEMSSKEVIDRIHQIALRDTYHGVWEDLSKPQRTELVDEWAGRCGRITISDPSGGPIDASAIAANHEVGSIAIVDYIGLMRSATGQRAVEDWRAAAMISNQLKEAALEHSIPIVSAAQINREGARSKDASPEHLAQSDALGQDADVLVTIQREKNVSRVHEYSLVKNRHGASGARWYARFEPGLRRFEDIGADAALSLMEADREIAEAH